MPIPKNASQTDEDKRFPLHRPVIRYSTFKKAVKNGEAPSGNSLERSSLPLHDVDWTNRETRRSKACRRKHK